MVAGLFIVDPCGCENSRGAKVRFGMPTISIRWQQHKHQHRITPTSCKVGVQPRKFGVCRTRSAMVPSSCQTWQWKINTSEWSFVRKCFNVLWHAKHAKLILESSLWCLKIDVRLPEDTEFINWRKIAGTSRPEPFGTKCVCVIAWNDYDKTIGIPVLKLTRGLLLLG